MQRPVSGKADQPVSQLGPLRVSQLNPRQKTTFVIQPDAARRKEIAAELGILDLPRLRFRATLSSAPADAWDLTADLDAKVVQACIVTLDPVTTDLSEPVHRVFSPHTTPPTAEETEMSDDEVEPLGQSIDLDAVMIESLSLALPLYPRADGAAMDDAAPDTSEPEDDARKPFAGLADLLGKRDEKG